MTAPADEELLFYHNPRSRSQMVHWMLEEVGAPYRIIPIDFEKREHKTPEFLALNPMGKLPTIVHRGTVVTETGAIIAYLADAFPAAGIAPALDDPRRGTWLRWLFFGGTVFEPALLDTMMKRPPINPMMAGFGSYEDALRALEQMLVPGPYILGDAFSAADVYLGAELSWAMGFGAPGLKGNPAFDAYVARVTDRPAYQRTRITA